MSRVSLIIPTFNRPHSLPQAVESAQRAGRDVEVIVVDDASCDETASVCAALHGIKYVRIDRNQGVAGARNAGLLESTADFIAFLDDDDLRLPGTLDHQVELLTNNPEAGFVAGGVVLADQKGVPTGEIAVPRGTSGDLFWKVLELDVHLIPGSVVVRKQCFFEVGIFNRKLAGIDDWDMWVRIAEVRPVLLDSEPVCIYRVASPGSGQGSSGMGRHLYSAVKHQATLFSLPRAQAASVAQRKSVRRNVRRRIADTLSWRAAEELPRGAYRFAASNFLYALRLSPLWAARPTHFRVLWRASKHAKS
ncbi:MAG TPA: glycosyltransferase family A protein [Pyrinomonadaceae bacterium]|nr:glycosyltransferase family A protein [Pyrinomonadaceae bacterium]